MADYLKKYTEAQADAYADQIRKVYAQAASEVKKKMSEFMAKHREKAARMLQDVKEGRISLQDYKDWLRGQVFQGNQWKQKLREITTTYMNADKKARSILSGTTRSVFTEAANYTAYDIEKGTRGAVSFDIYDEHTVDRLIRQDPQMLPEWKIDEEKDYIWNEKRVQNSILQGIIQGESIAKIGRRLEGELASDNASKMNMFARTAVTGAQNAGRVERLHESKEMGIEVKKVWTAIFDKRTRDAHAFLDGQAVDVDDPFITEDGKKINYPGDPTASPELVYNCRCTLTYIHPKYQHLQHIERRDQETGEIVTDMTYRQWAERKRQEEERKKQEEQRTTAQPVAHGTPKPITLNDIWKPSGDYTPAGTQKEFMMQNMAELKKAGVRNATQIREQYENTAMQTAINQLHRVSEQEAVDTIRNGIPENTLNGWFVEADSSIKPKIVDYIIGDPDILNSGWNIAYRNYMETTGDSSITFEEFLSTPIKMYRGTHGQSEVADDTWVSFSTDRKIAESFGGTVEEILIRPIDTWGSYQTTAEAEILVPKRWLETYREEQRSAVQDTPKPIIPVSTRSVSADDFVPVLDAAKASCPEDKAWRVDTSRSAEDFRQDRITTFITAGGSTFALKDDGDIISVCKNQTTDKGTNARSLLAAAVEAGGTHLDSFDGNFGFYVRCGFEPVSRCAFDEQYAPPGWVKGRDQPEDIYFMRYVGVGNVRYTTLEEARAAIAYSAGYDEAEAVVKRAVRRKKE